jgi:hypothetical protein
VTSEQALTAAIDALNAMRLPYMLVGSFSSNHYGVLRGWCGRHGTLDLLEELDRSSPPIE